MKRLMLMLVLMLVSLNAHAVKRQGVQNNDTTKIATDTNPAVDKTLSTVIAMDLDDVMSIKQKPGALDFISIARAVFWNPWVLGALTKIGELQQEGSQVGQSMNGTSNVVHEMLKKLKDRGYGDFSYYEDEIVAAATKPKPIDQMIQAVRELKKKGYIVIAATNQDWKQHAAYRQKMKQQGVDLNKLFDAVVTTAVNYGNVSQAAQKGGFYNPVINENIYAATAQDAYKPHAGYYTLVKKVADYIAETKHVPVKRIIFADDKAENIQGATQAQMQGIHFDLPGGSARKTSPQDLQNTINKWKQDLRKHSVEIQ